MNQLLESITGYIKRCQDARDGHYKQSERLNNTSKFLGYLLIYCTVFVTVFSLFPVDTNYEFIIGITSQHFVVLIGCLSAVISGILTQSRYGERSERHNRSAVEYGSIARQLELLKDRLSSNEMSVDEGYKQLKTKLEQWDLVSSQAMLTPKNGLSSNFLLHLLILSVFIVLFFLVVGNKDNKKNDCIKDGSQKIICIHYYQK